MAVASGMGDRGLLARAQVELGWVLREPSPQRAEDVFRAVLRTGLDAGLLDIAARCQIGLGVQAAARGNWGIARELLSEARSSAAAMGKYRDRITSEIWLALCEAELGNGRGADLMARDAAEALDARPVYRRLVAQGLQGLAANVQPRDPEVAMGLVEQARRIEDRLGRG